MNIARPCLVKNCTYFHRNSKGLCHNHLYLTKNKKYKLSYSLDDLIRCCPHDTGYRVPLPGDCLPYPKKTKKELDEELNTTWLQRQTALLKTKDFIIL